MRAALGRCELADGAELLHSTALHEGAVLVLLLQLRRLDAADRLRLGLLGLQFNQTRMLWLERTSFSEANICIPLENSKTTDAPRLHRPQLVLMAKQYEFSEAGLHAPFSG